MKPTGGLDTIGRDSALASLAATVSRASGGFGSLTVVIGEPGIGKTHLVRAATLALPEGSQLAWADCARDQGAPALWPWLRIGRQLGLQLVDGVGWDRAGSAGDDDTGEPASRFAAYQTAVEHLAAMCRDHLVVVVLDDLHWADAATVELLQYLLADLARLRMVVIATCRQHEIEPGSQLHRLLTGPSSSQHQLIELLGLTGTDLPRLAASFGAEVPSGDDAGALLRTTGGNPLFVREVLRAGLGSGVPATVEDVIRRRLLGLPAPAGRTLRALAVAGRSAPLELVVAMLDSTADQVTDDLQPALRQRLLTLDQGSLTFTHALVHTVVLADLTTAEAAPLHLAAAGALGDDAIETVGRHLLLAGPLAPVATTVAALRAAADRAASLAAYEDAVGHLDNAAALSEGSARARIELELADAASLCGLTSRARAAVARVAEHARSVGDGRLLAQAALALGRELAAGQPDEFEIALCREALDLVGDDDPRLWARLQARLARSLLFSDSHEAERVARSTEAVASARRHGAPAELVAVLLDRAIAVWGTANPAERRTSIEEVVELAAAVGDRRRELTARGLLLGVVLELGDRTAYDAEIERYETVMSRYRVTDLAWQIPMLRATTAALDGRFDEAAALIEHGRAAGERVQFDGLIAFVLSAEACLRYASGRFGSMRQEIVTHLGANTHLSAMRVGFAFTSVAAGALDDARAGLEEVVVDGEVRLAKDFMRPFNLWSLCAVAADLGDGDRARVLYRELRPLSGAAVRLSRNGIGCFGAVDLGLGLAAGVAGDPEAAVHHLEQAVDIARRLRARPFVADARLALAEALEGRGGLPDRARAAALRQQAHDEAAALGISLPLRRPVTHGGEPPLMADRQAPGGAARFSPVGSSPEPTVVRGADRCRLTFQGATVELGASVGLNHLIELLQRPGVEMRATDLGGAAPTPYRGEAVLDEEAKSAYRRRLAALDAEIDEAERWNDSERAAAAHRERDLLLDELRAATGLGGRDRRLGADDERARIRVTKAVRATIRRLADQHPELGRHLERHVRTGTWCVYSADTVTWRIVDDDGRR